MPIISIALAVLALSGTGLLMYISSLPVIRLSEVSGSPRRAVFREPVSGSCIHSFSVSTGDMAEGAKSAGALTFTGCMQAESNASSNEGSKCFILESVRDFYFPRFLLYHSVSFQISG